MYLLVRYLLAFSLILPLNEEGMAFIAKERQIIEGDCPFRREQTAMISAAARAKTRIIARGLAWI
jgi:hypothetical protein